jgi:hypothetical protein
MTFDGVPNEPAGRLRQVLAALRAVSSSTNLSGLWEQATQQLTPLQSDTLAVRAEAGALYRAVEVSIESLPDIDERAAYAAYRRHWATPIFGIALSDGHGKSYTGPELVNDDGLRTLAMLSGTLRHSTPEPTQAALADDDLVQHLNEVRDILLQVRSGVLQARWIDPRTRTRLVSLLTDAADSITFVRFRGLGAVERGVLSVEVELVAAESQVPDETLLEPLRSLQKTTISQWTDAIRGAVRRVRETIEYDALPMAMGAATFVHSGDLRVAIAAWVGTRVMLEGRHPAPPIESNQPEAIEAPKPEQEPGDQEDQDPASPTDA